MWLINVRTLHLEYVMDPTRYSYAILSHTWDDDEVSFQEFRDLALARGKKGFAKIAKTCELAEEFGLLYAWVDTCCIDKSSSTELSEAINCMFRWYRSATVCFAYLADLAAPASDTAAWNLGQAMKPCRWLTRGWTLQELLAPNHLNFFGADWTPLGTKSGLVGELASMTGIRDDVLRDPDLIPSVPVGVRLSWAACRETTRPEDMSYCLLGILDISMPMLYGEGHRAFIRLQEEICKQSNDMTLFAWSPNPNRPGYLRQTYLGLFAQHPADFHILGSRGKHGRIRHITHSESFKGEFSVTNRGLRFDDIGLVQPADYVLYLRLDCGYETDEGLALLCISLDLAVDGYYRLASQDDGCLMVNLNSMRPAQIPLFRRIYINKSAAPSQSTKIGHQLSKSIFPHIHPIGFRIHGKNWWTLKFINIQPEESWSCNRQAFVTGSGHFFGFLEGWVYGERRFVIICHASNDHGYDFGMELEGTSETWRAWKQLQTDDPSEWRSRDFQEYIIQRFQSAGLMVGNSSVTIPLYPSELRMVLFRYDSGLGNHVGLVLDDGGDEGFIHLGPSLWFSQQSRGGFGGL